MKTNNILKRLSAMAAGVLLLPSIALAESAALTSLEVRANGHNLVENFSGENTGYSLQFDSPVKVTLSAVPESPTATVAINVNSQSFTNHSVAPLKDGANTITCTVTDGALSRTYDIALDVSAPVRTLYFKSGGWSAQPYVYIYTQAAGSSSSSEHAGKWPGAQMTKFNDVWYSYTLPESADTDAQVIFNTGENGSDRYPADQQPGVKLDFEGSEGWYVLADKKFYATNPDGPQKPRITVTPAGGKVKGTRSITISFSCEPTEVSGTFAGKELQLNANGINTLTVGDFLAEEGAEGTLSVTASNAIGSTSFTATYTRSDIQPVVTLTGDHRELSIYQVMVASFQHGEGGGEGYTMMWGPDGHRKNGNLRGIINALDYIKELGMNALWMTPVFDSTNGTGGERLQATGYFCNDYFNIDPKFGTKEEFRELVDACHERGIYVILDGVFGHHGGLPKTSPNGLAIDASSDATNVRGTDTGNIAFPGSLPFFKEVVRYWMDEYGVDGWRLDQCYQVYQGGHNYWNDLRTEVEAVCSERRARGEQWGTLGFMVGEDWTSAGSITVTQQDGLKSVMDFDGKDRLLSASNVSDIATFLSQDASSRGYRDAGVNPTLFLSNHDTSRLGDKFDINSNTAALMARHAAVACYSGPTCTYYGDEIGDKHGPAGGDNGGAGDNWARTSGRLDGFSANEQLLHDYVAKVFNIRRENPAMWRGSMSRKSESGLEVLTKTDAETGNTIVVIFSESDRNVSISGSGEDLINGGRVSGSVSVKAWVPAFIRMD